MLKSRRKFLVQATAGVLGAAVASRGSQAQNPVGQTPGAPPTFGSATPVGPEVSPSAFAEAAKLADVEMTAADCAQAAGSWRRSLAPLHERRTGPRKVSLEPAVPPWSRWDPVLPGTSAGPQRDRFIWSRPDPGPLPGRDEDIAFAPLTHLARWVETRQITSERLTHLYLDRLERFNPKLRCVITLTRETALAQA